jgi:stage II sporulation protein D
LLLLLIVLIAVVVSRHSQPRFWHGYRMPVAVYSRQEGKVYHLEMEEYVVGVVAAEMPVRFHFEALKAQAVAARTLAVKRLRIFGGRGSAYCQDVDFSDDPDESQAWISIAGLKRKWHDRSFMEHYRLIREAVRDTRGLIITYQGQPIDAVYHSTCGVGTADASEVWQHPVPYLVHVPCGFDHHSPHWQTRYFISWPDLAERLGLTVTDCYHLRIVKRSPTRRVLTLRWGNHQMDGNQFRKALGLTSTCFGWENTQNGIKLTVIGYGHGVGMCQYGADGMANLGWKYPQILQYYYHGVQLARISD